MKILNIKSNLSQKNSMHKNTDLYLRHVAEKKNRYHISYFWNKIAIFVKFQRNKVLLTTYNKV